MPPLTAGPAAAPQVDPAEFGEYSDWAKGEMGKGFSADQLRQTLASSGGQTQPKKKGNWLTNALPTIGSVAIPALGALLAPVTGGTSLIAAAGLSAAGAAGGKLAENAIEGNGMGDDLVKAGAEGAIGGGVGGMAGKVLGKTAKALSGRAAKMTSQKAATQEAEDAIETAANTYKDISPQLQKAYNAKGSLEHVKNMGFDIADPKNLTHVADSSNDVLNEALNRALSSSGPVDLAHFPNIIKEALAKQGGTLGAFDKVALSRGRMGYADTPAAKLLQQIGDLGAGTAKSQSDPNELRTLTTKLGELLADNKPTVTAATGAKDPVQVARYNAIKEIRDSVKSHLYDRPDVNDSVKGMIGNLTAEDVGSQQLAQHLNDVLTKAGTGNKGGAQDLLDEISRNINISKLGQEGQRVGQIVTSTGGKARAAAEAGLGEPGLDTHPLLETAGALTGGAGGGGMLGTAVQGAARAAQNPAILETLSRIGGLGSKLAPAAGAAVATAPNLGADPVSATGGPGGTMGGNMNNQPGMMANGTTDPNSMGAILSQFMRMGTVNPYMMGDVAPTIQALAPAVQKQHMLGTTLDAMPESFANAGGAQGEGGIMSRISGLIPGTAANTYQSQQGAVAQQLAAAMGISPEAAASLLPQLMQNSQTASIPTGILQSMRGQLAY